jgi:integrase
VSAHAAAVGRTRGICAFRAAEGKDRAVEPAKNGTPRGVPLNRDAVDVLEAEREKHPVFCFTYRGEPIAWEMTNSARHTAREKSGISDFRFHDLRHTSASWHRQAGTSCDELKDLGGWKSRVMVDRYAKFGTPRAGLVPERARDTNEDAAIRREPDCHRPDNNKVRNLANTCRDRSFYMSSPRNWRAV